MKGLSSTALAKTTSLAHPTPPADAVRAARSLMVSPIWRTASMLMPACVEATFTEAQTRSVTASASGMEEMRTLSPPVSPFWTRAVKPPRKFTPTVLAALSRVRAYST